MKTWQIHHIAEDTKPNNDEPTQKMRPPYTAYACQTEQGIGTRIKLVLHGESNTSQASPRMTIQRMCQPQEEEQP